MSSVSLFANEWHYSEYCVEVQTLHSYTYVCPMSLQPTVNYFGAASVAGKVRFTYSITPVNVYNMRTLILAILVKLCCHATFFSDIEFMYVCMQYTHTCTYIPF